MEREGVDGKETKDVKSRKDGRGRARDRNLME
jgi:hypothetical protein